MADPGTLHDAFIDELRDAYDAEKQITKALPKMAKAATSPELRAAFESHLEETREQIQRLEEVFASLEEKVRGKHCDGMEGIIEEGKSVMEEEFDDSTMDACLVASAQRVEHYEMAAYGTLVAWARAMGHEEAAGLLQQTLDEEKAADEKLTSIAEAGINQEAADAAHPADEDEDEALVAASLTGTTATTIPAATTAASTGEGEMHVDISSNHAADATSTEASNPLNAYAEPNNIEGDPESATKELSPTQAAFEGNESPIETILVDVHSPDASSPAQAPADGAESDADSDETSYEML